MKQKLLISFSGGRTSAYMTYWLLNEWKDRDKWEMIVVYANTGKEREETLEFIDLCDKAFNMNVVWLEFDRAIVIDLSTPELESKKVRHRVVNYTTASRKGEPFEAMIKVYGMPNQNFPQCSRELKRNTIKSYAKSIGWEKYYTAIGIRSDETARLNWAEAKKNRLIYPFAQYKSVTTGDVNKWWSMQGFDLPIKSYEGNCDLCWKKSMRKLMTIAKENPQLTDWWKEMETKYEKYVPAHRSASSKLDKPIRFFRDNNSFDDIIEESAFPFKPAVDESKKLSPKQNSLFGWDEYMDSNDGCVESCEVF